MEYDDVTLSILMTTKHEIKEKSIAVYKVKAFTNNSEYAKASN